MLCALAFAAQGSTANAFESLTIKEAVQKGYISVTMKGVGGTFGPCIVVEMNNHLNDTFSVLLDPGMTLIPDERSHQDMLVTMKSEEILYPFQYKEVYAYAMCGEKHDSSPTGMNYTFGRMVHGSLKKLIKVIEKDNAQDQAGQYAIWAVTDNMKASEGANNATVRNAEKLLRKANVSVSMFSETRTAVREIVEEELLVFGPVLPDSVSLAPLPVTVASVPSFSGDEVDDSLSKNKVMMIGLFGSMILLLAFAVIRGRVT